MLPAISVSNGLRVIFYTAYRNLTILHIPLISFACFPFNNLCSFLVSFHVSYNIFTYNTFPYGISMFYTSPLEVDYYYKSNRISLCGR